jgi:hypothetical protein
MLTLALELGVGIAVGVRRTGEAVAELRAAGAVELAVPAEGSVADAHAVISRLNEQSIATLRERAWGADTRPC